MIVTVYSISHNDKIIYFGQTTDIKRRTYQHNYSLRKNASKEVKKKKQLYTYCNNNNVTELTLDVVREFGNKTDATRYECFLILEDYFHKRELIQSVPRIAKI